LTNSGGATFAGLSAGVLTLTDTTGTITIDGALDLTTLNTADKGYALQLLGGGSVTNAVTFTNTGALTLGDGAGDSFSFNGGVSFDNLLTLNVDTVPGGASSLDRANEAVALSVAIPTGATEAIVQFRMADAGNDWWWALDNIVVSEGVGAPSPFGFITEIETVFETTRPLIEWEAAAEADSYNISVARQPDGSEVVFADEGIVDTSTEVGPFNSGRYYVTVTAVNSGGEREALNGPLSIFVVNPCPGDFDGDGTLSIFDFLAFQNAFDAGCP